MSDTSRSDRIRDRAYGIWESEGRADGHHERHWHQASQEIEDTEGPELPHDAGEPPANAEDASMAAEGEAGVTEAQSRTSD